MAKQSELNAEIKDLRARLAEAEETLEAIRTGAVDALVAGGPGGEQIFTLQGAETPYRILVEEMNQGALLVIPDGTVLFANSRFADLSKTPLEQVIGGSWRRFFSKDFHAQLDACLASPATTSPAEELSLEAADGSHCPVHVSLRSMVTSGLAGVSVIVTDLTERKQSENALRKTSNDLMENNRQLETFSHSVSHDMRAPLRAMQGFGQLLLQDYGHEFGAEARSYLDRIVASADQLDQLITDVLAYCRLARDQSEARIFDLDKMVCETVETYPNLRDANIEIVHSAARVRGFAVPLAQCILNLLSNAVKFVPPGRAPMIKVWSEPSNGRLRVWVEDNGIGILPADQEKIFELFTRVHIEEGYEGTGIGLSMVKTAVEKMGGRVGVVSELGLGSRFWIELESA